MSSLKALGFQRFSFHYSAFRKPQEIDIRSNIKIFIGKNHREKKSSSLFNVAKQIVGNTMAAISCSYHVLLDSNLKGAFCGTVTVMNNQSSPRWFSVHQAQCSGATC